MGGGPCTNLGEAAGGSCRILAGWWRRVEASLNRAVARSPVGRYFKLESRKSTFTRELCAGAATFLTMAYIISVNAAILTDSGGTCTASDCSPPPFAAELGHLSNLTRDQSGHHHRSSVHGHENCKFVPNAGYQRCLDRTRSDLVVATVVSAMAGCLAMGSLANLPLALAPGMGANTYFAYNLVGFHGSGPVPYRTALAVVLVEGCVFFLLSATGLRGRLARLIPRSVRLAAAAGIGLFLAFVGLQRHHVGMWPTTSRDIRSVVAICKRRRRDHFRSACTLPSFARRCRRPVSNRLTGSANAGSHQICRCQISANPYAPPGLRQPTAQLRAVAVTRR